MSDKNNDTMKIGMDVGSTTLKAVVLNKHNNIVYKNYIRHFSKIGEKTCEMLDEIAKTIGGNTDVSLCISGSAGMGIAEQCSIPFIQEVYATRLSTESILGEVDAVIELGGEDAKILFLRTESGADSDLEARMNGSCAGGTGAFVDQMATLLNITPDEMNELAKHADKTYTIASRCGVFAKSDIQPLLNQGAQKSDISASIFLAMVNQTIGGLAQGRPIKGRVVYLGGPLTFLSELRRSFDEALGLKGICPENSLYFVALGAAMRLQDTYKSPLEWKRAIEGAQSVGSYISCPPVFDSPEDFERFTARHNGSRVETTEDTDYTGDVYIGVDAGSTTVKAVAIDESENILTSRYLSNKGNPVEIVGEFLKDFYRDFPGAKIRGSAVTGYGEDIIKNAYSFDIGIVETIAHFTAAKKFQPEVDFIIDIGGQDIKCFKIKNGVIDNIFLNEACSSGCGSFLQTFAAVWDMDIESFAKIGLASKNPVDLGSRCTVFMNSSVKQAQKDGASIEDISAGLSISVVKNALYKVIRATNVNNLGKNIVVQGGTFLNDVVLRAFEAETGRDVVRPNIAGIMGAFGAALYAKQQQEGDSAIISEGELLNFTHKKAATICQSCSNHCSLTINTFSGGRRFIGGNRCERPVRHGQHAEHYNIFDYKNALLRSYPTNKNGHARIGIPMALNMYELVPFWQTILTELGFEVVLSPNSSRNTYIKGQGTIPSDTVCYPAKLAHGHIEDLLDMNVDCIFYPCLTYNFSEGRGDNHYNCPVVAYYPEVISSNMPRISETTFVYDYFSLSSEKHFAEQLINSLSGVYGGLRKKDVIAAYRKGVAAYGDFLKSCRDKAEEYLRIAKEKSLPVIILAGRPYHIDSEVNHGMDTLICDLGAVVLSEDSVSHMTGIVPTSILDQWTYHSRLYAAAEVAIKLGENVNLVQLVSFGCGLDAVTTDETRRILEAADRIYTQIKIDEVTNLGAVKIRLRSLFAALNQKEEKPGRKASRVRVFADEIKS